MHITTYHGTARARGRNGEEARAMREYRDRGLSRTGVQGENCRETSAKKSGRECTNTRSTRVGKKVDQVRGQGKKGRVGSERDGWQYKEDWATMGKQEGAL
jgi:hypothetical protein